MCREQGRPSQQECVHTTCFSTGSRSHVSVYFMSQMCFFFFFSFILYDFYSDDVVLDHVIKLFIVLYRALQHGDLGWMLCVSGLWCCSSYFLKLEAVRRARMREPWRRLLEPEVTAVLEWHML